MNKTIAYLRKREWSMGNGQCPDCCGCKPGFDHKDSPLQRRQGHKLKCPLRAVLVELNCTVVNDHQPPLSIKGRQALDDWNNKLVPVFGQTAKR